MHAISSYRSNRPTHKHRPPQTHKPTDKTDYNLCTAPLHLARSVIINLSVDELIG